MQKIKDALKQIGQVIQPGERIVFIDYPVYPNVGDLLIQEGTERFFEIHGIKPLARYSVHLYFLKKPVEFPRGCTIVFQGGGNFGDIHRPYQQLREQIIAANHNRKIVILPQSIHYASTEALIKSSAILRAHPNLHIFCRDEPSHRLSLEYFSAQSYPSPDMAHFLYPIARSGASEGKQLLLLRRDNETGSAQERYHGTAPTVDWHDIVSLQNYYLIRSFTALHIGAAKAGVLPSFYPCWRPVQKKVISDIVREFSRYDSVTTSRLHAHILATLMEIPNTVIDNSYGKNSRYFNDWTSSLTNARLSPQAA